MTGDRAPARAFGIGALVIGALLVIGTWSLLIPYDPRMNYGVATGYG